MRTRTKKLVTAVVLAVAVVCPAVSACSPPHIPPCMLRCL